MDKPNAVRSKWRWILGVVLLLLLCFVVSVPSLLSSQKGVLWLCKQLQRQTGGQWQIEHASFHWFGPQTITKINGSLPAHQVALSVDKLESSASLWDLAFFNHFGILTVEKPIALFEQIPKTSPIQKTTPQHASLLPMGEISFAPALKKYRGHLLVKQGAIHFKDPLLKGVAIDPIDFEMNIEKQTSFSLGATAVEGTHQGKMEISGTFASENTKHAPSSMHVQIKQLPTTSLDHVVTLFFPEYTGAIPSLTGPELNIDADVTLQASGGSIQLKALSELINIDLEGTLSSSEFTLVRPALFQIHFTPALVTVLSKTIPSLQTFNLNDTATLQCDVTALTIPYPWAEGLTQSSFDLKASLNQGVTGVFSGIPFSVDQIALSSNTPSLQKYLAIDYSMIVSIAGKAGSLQVHTALDSLFASPPHGSFTCQMTQFPLFILQAVGLNAEELLGQYADMTLSLTLSDAHPQGQFSWDSERLHIPSTSLVLGPKWTLAHPVTISYEPNISMFPFISRLSTLHGTLQTFSFIPKNPDALTIEAQLTCDEMVLTGSIAQPFHDLSVLFSMQGLQKINLSLKSDALKGSIQAALDTKKQTLSFTAPISFHYIASSAQFPLLAAPAHIQCSIDPYTINLQNPSPLGFKGQFFISELSLKTGSKPLVLQKNTALFQWKEESKRVDLQLSSQIQGEQEAAIQGQLSFFPLQGKNNSFSLDDAPVEGKLQFKQFSSSFLSIVSQNPLIPFLVGETFNADLLFSSTPQGGSLDLNWSSPLFSFKTSFAMTHEGFTLKAPTTCQWTLTPHAYSYLEQMAAPQSTSALQLTENVPVSFLVSKCFLPTQAPATIEVLTQRIFSLSKEWSPLEFVSTMTIGMMHILDPLSKERIELPNLKISLYKNKGENPLMFTADTTVTTQQGSSQKGGSFTSSLQLLPSFDQNKDLDWMQTAMTVSIQAKQFPSKLLDFISRWLGILRPPFASLFGPTLQVNFDTKIQALSGPISFSFHSAGAEMHLKGHLDNGALLLDEPLHTQLMLTESSSRFLLQEVNPLNLSAIYTQNPITLDVGINGFYLPLHPLAKEKVTIPQARLELGKVTCKNEGNVNTALNLLKSSSSDPDIRLWFAPLDFSVTQGIATIDRTEFLVSDTFDLCFFGTIDIVKDWVDMTLGLTASALDRAFGIKGLPEHYVLTIPMKGKMDDVQINTAKATAKVALLLAWQHDVLSGTIKGPAGALANALVGAVATLPDANAKIPPAKHPFPWEVGQEKKAVRKSKKKTFKPSDKPVKQIMKVL